MRPNFATSPQGRNAMMLVLQCPVCLQSLIYRGPRSSGHSATCPRCEAPLMIRSPKLNEQEILSILGRPVPQA
jgi:hypothetical protein